MFGCSFSQRLKLTQALEVAEKFELQKEALKKSVPKKTGYAVFPLTKDVHMVKVLVQTYHHRDVHNYYLYGRSPECLDTILSSFCGVRMRKCYRRIPASI